MIIKHASDIYCINEAHLSGDDKICIEGYKWFGHNRTSRHVRAPKTHGGVGILIKFAILTVFVCEVIDNTLDGIFALKLTHKHSDYQCVIYACYLPPENSAWGRNADAIFNHILTELYLYSDVDDIFICGDFNSRIVSMCDVDYRIDDVPKRQNIDDVVNNHGKSFVEFANDAN